MTLERILVVDDDTSNREAIALILEDESFAVTRAKNDDDALLLADRTRPDLVILDMHARGTTALTVAHHMKERDPSMAILAVSTLSTRLPSLPHPHFAAVLTKPFDIDDLLDVVHGLTRPIATSAPVPLL